MHDFVFVVLGYRTSSFTTNLLRGWHHISIVLKGAKQCSGRSGNSRVDGTTAFNKFTYVFILLTICTEPAKLNHSACEARDLAAMLSLRAARSGVWRGAAGNLLRHGARCSSSTAGKLMHISG